MLAWGWSKGMKIFGLDLQLIAQTQKLHHGRSKAVKPIYSHHGMST